MVMFKVLVMHHLFRQGSYQIVNYLLIITKKAGDEFRLPLISAILSDSICQSGATSAKRAGESRRR